MFEGALEIFRGISHKRVQRLKGDVLFVGVEKLGAPKFLIGKKMFLSGAAAGECEPLHVVCEPDVVGGGIIESRVRGSGRNEGGQMRRKLFRCGPLIKSGVGTAPHGHFAVAEWLLGKPLDNVVAIARLIGKGLKLPFGISASPHIYKRKSVAVRGKIRGPVVVSVGDIRSEGENDRRPWRRAIQPLWQI